METPEDSVIKQLMQKLNKAVSLSKGVRYVCHNIHTKDPLLITKIGKISISFWNIVDQVINYADRMENVKSQIKNKPKEIQMLIIAIFSAIITSSEVQKFMRDDENCNLLITIFENDKEISYSIDVEGLINNMLALANPQQLPTMSPQRIDGIPLTKKEEKFEEYYADKFNEEDWLKKNQLTFEPKPEKNDKKKKKDKKT
ncbi:MAG: hypothetical protein HYT28_01685 [Parcubacteria group bacterium]|nr:hypothetical protein [Parcubacteria group bacterium]